MHWQKKKQENTSSSESFRQTYKHTNKHEYPLPSKNSTPLVINSDRSLTKAFPSWPMEPKKISSCAQEDEILITLDRCITHFLFLSIYAMFNRGSSITAVHPIEVYCLISAISTFMSTMYRCKWIDQPNMILPPEALPIFICILQALHEKPRHWWNSQHH